MEYAEKGDLERRIRNKKKFYEESEIWFYFIQIMKGLQALHSANVLHWDLKSANIFLSKQGEIKLGDLNVSKILKTDICKHT